MATAKKTAAKKTPAKKSAAKKSAAKKGPARTTSAKATPKKVADSKSASKQAAGKHAAPKDDNYTKPELREHIKEEVMAGDKGGKPGQWSARKAQLVAHEYVAEGGGYKHPRNEAQQHLKQWGDEHWHTADGKPAIREDGEGHEETHRYLPDEAWKELSPEQKKATDTKKVRGSHKGEQYVANTAEAKEARQHVSKKSNAE